MDAVTLYGLCAATLVGLGVYGLIANPAPLRKILALNLVGNGIFLACAVIARRGAGAGMAGDPVPQAMLITAIVVAFAATALGIALTVRLQELSGAASLSDEAPACGQPGTHAPYAPGGAEADATLGADPAPDGGTAARPGPA